MHVYDIEDAVDRGDLSGVHRALGVLLNHPNRTTVAGAHLSGRLDQLLDRVISALQLDSTVLPPQLRETIEQVTGVSFAPEATYAEAVTIVFEFRGAWKALHRGVAA